MTRIFVLVLMIFTSSCAQIEIKDTKQYNNIEIANKIVKVFPNLILSSPSKVGHIHVVDSLYLLPARAEAIFIIEVSKSSFGLSYKPQVNDCDDISLSLSNNVAKKFSQIVRQLTYEGVLPFGVVSGVKFNKITGHHSWNIFVCSDTILFYDAYLEKYWDATMMTDDIYFVWI